MKSKFRTETFLKGQGAAEHRASIVAEMAKARDDGCLTEWMREAKRLNATKGFIKLAYGLHSVDTKLGRGKYNDMVLACAKDAKALDKEGKIKDQNEKHALMECTWNVT